MLTEELGLQSYMAKGFLKPARPGSGKSACLQPGALIEAIVYHDPNKKLLLLKDCSWSMPMQSSLTDIVKNCVLVFIMETLTHVFKQQGGGKESFRFVETILRWLDSMEGTALANFPIYFCQRMATELGYGLQGEYSDATPVLDLKEGTFVETPVYEKPIHIKGEVAVHASEINLAIYSDTLAQIKMAKRQRQQLLDAMIEYLSLHVAGFGTIRSLGVVQSILA